METYNREEIYEDRLQKFLKAIKEYESEELRKIKQKSKDEQEFETNAIMKEAREKDELTYSKKQKGVEVESKIARSRKINEMRLSKMKLRFEMIEKIQAEVNSSLLEKICNKSDYRALLESLLIQGMIRLLEENIEVKCLPRDLELVTDAATRAENHFKEICDVKTKLTISHERLPESDLGGVILTTFRGKIVCNNTLRARLDYAVQLSLPKVRAMLFPVESAVKN